MLLFLQTKEMEGTNDLSLASIFLSSVLPASVFAIVAVLLVISGT